MKDFSETDFEKRPKSGVQKNRAALNAVCPYYTMFPLEFPANILSRHSRISDRIIDPFCGRGTSIFAARLRNQHAVGIDSSPVAVAIAKAKTVAPTVHEIVEAAKDAIDLGSTSILPNGKFWELAFHDRTLRELTALRSGLMRMHEDGRDDPPVVALRAIALGALHGPLTKGSPSYFSNQCTRTYSPKPRYSIQFWSERGLVAPNVDIIDVIKRRAERYFGVPSVPYGRVIFGDSRQSDTLRDAGTDGPYKMVITSPPYYGMVTYISDQWLRNWFLGGPDHVDYRRSGQLKHISPDVFASDLRRVWRGLLEITTVDARLALRFGGIGSRAVDPLDVAKHSLSESGWRLVKVHQLKLPPDQRRQSNLMRAEMRKHVSEYVIWAHREDR